MNEDGFTLIELIVIVAILAFLATLLIPRVTKVISRAKDTTYEANITIIRNALERYYVDHDRYPDDLKRLVPDYLQELPEKTSDDGEVVSEHNNRQNRDYKYEPSSDGQSYTLDEKRYGAKGGEL